MHSLSYAIVLISLLEIVCGYEHRFYDSKQHVIVDKSYDKDFNMIVMGDWGGLPIPPYYSPFEKVTAMQIMQVAKEKETDSLLALGDNFYYNGVENEYDSRFKETFENVFDEPSFESLQWYVLAGNHDHYGNVTGQLEYSKHSSRWNFPKLWYGISIQRPEFNMTIMMVDTVTLCGNTLYNEEGGAPDGVVDEAQASDQLQYIENLLKSSKDDYLLVAGHFPVWSIAEHGPTQCLIDKLKPLMEKYRVNAYFCGHDHNLQHIKESNSSVEYFVSGAVDVVDPSTKHEDSIPPKSLQFYWANILGLGGFASVTVNKEKMTVEFISAVGKSLYQRELLPRK